MDISFHMVCIPYRIPNSIDEFLENSESIVEEISNAMTECYPEYFKLVNQSISALELDDSDFIIVFEAMVLFSSDLMGVADRDERLKASEDNAKNVIEELLGNLVSAYKLIETV